MNNIKNIAKSIVGAAAWPFMLLRAAWAHRKPGNKLGLFDRCPLRKSHGPCIYASGKRCTAFDDVECPK